MIHNEMINQANKFQDQTEKQKYLDAAAKFRLPYWDMFMPRNKQQGNDMTTIFGLPQLLKAENVFLKEPGAPKEFVSRPNPMYKFVFPTSDEWKKPRKTSRRQMNFNTNTETVRTPDSNGKTNNDRLNLAIQRQATAKANEFWKMISSTAVDEVTGAAIGKINQIRPWSYFANHSAEYSMGGAQKFTVNGQQWDTVSLESFHDGIHTLVGTGAGKSGQMGSPSVAAFEPLFWLHHNNIDRVLSLYQALYAKNVEDQEELLKPLVPFMKSADRKFWTSDDNLVKTYSSPGFGMPTNPGGKLTADGIKAVVQQYLTDTYYWATTRGIREGAKIKTLPGAEWPKNLKPSEALHGKDAVSVPNARVAMRAVALSDSGAPMLMARSVPVTMQAHAEVENRPIMVSSTMQKISDTIDTLPQDAVTVPAAEAKPSPQVPAHQVVVGENKQPLQVWDAHVSVRKHAFNGSFNVHVFIGYVKDDQPERFMTKKNEVGFMGIFARSNEAAAECANCQVSQAQDLQVASVVPLTTYLTDYLDANPIAEGLIRDGNKKTIHDLGPEEVVPFLREHLQWRITDLSSTLLSGQEQDAKLRVAVTRRVFYPPDENNLMGVYGPETVHAEITNNKAGGLGFVYADGTVNQ